jgi:hypothetical protein
MEHPLIHGIEDLTLEELGSKVSELYKKLAIAQRMGNGHLCEQINMALSSYSVRHQEKLNDLLKSGDRPGFDNKIDIS